MLHDMTMLVKPTPGHSRVVFRQKSATKKAFITGCIWIKAQAPEAQNDLYPGAGPPMHAARRFLEEIEMGAD